jgi:hypothetical protein
MTLVAETTLVADNTFAFDTSGTVYVPAHADAMTIYTAADHMGRTLVLPVPAIDDGSRVVRMALNEAAAAGLVVPVA